MGQLTTGVYKQTEDIKDCPFCGGTEMSAGFTEHDGRFIRCDSCCSCSGDFGTIDEAKVLWNTRKG